VSTRAFQDLLESRARASGTPLTSDLRSRLETYYHLLAIWNRKINLSGHDLADPTPAAIDRLLVEPVKAAQYAKPDWRRMIDIGSGGGSPAIPFALAAPHLSLLMVESKGRKSAFLREAIRAVGLSGADVVTARFEQLLDQGGMRSSQDLLTVRAVRLDGMIPIFESLLRPLGQLFLFRGRASEPADTLESWLTVCAEHPLIDSLGSRLVVLERRG
jgi:16S rRNA (guanine527-N7)-methyltransferase